jgi:hypothetical protein
LSRLLVEADSPGASGPNSDASASEKSPVDTPFKYSHGNNVSTLLERLIYGGRIEE